VLCPDFGDCSPIPSVYVRSRFHSKSAKRRRKSAQL
jgi:hypothetical protein